MTEPTTYAAYDTYYRNLLCWGGKPVTSTRPEAILAWIHRRSSRYFVLVTLERV